VTADPSIGRLQDEDDYMLRRFLRARDHHIGKASAMLLKYLKWKAKVALLILGLISSTVLILVWR